MCPLSQVLNLSIDHRTLVPRFIQLLYLIYFIFLLSSNWRDCNLERKTSRCKGHCASHSGSCNESGLASSSEWSTYRFMSVCDREKEWEVDHKMLLCAKDGFQIWIDRRIHSQWHLRDHFYIFWRTFSSLRLLSLLQYA